MKITMEPLLNVKVSNHHVATSVCVNCSVKSRAPSRSVTIRNFPFGDRSFSEPDMAFPNDAKSCEDLTRHRTKQRKLASFYEVMSGFAKLKP